MKRLLLITSFVLLVIPVVPGAQAAAPYADGYERWESPYSGDLLGSSGSGTPQVNPSSGGISLTATDLALPGKGGFTFSIKRHYSSQQARFPVGSYAYSLGAGWRLSLPWVKEDGTVVLPDGGIMNIERTRTNIGKTYFDPVSGYRYIDNGTGTLMHKNGTQYCFNSAGLVTGIVSPNGKNRITIEYKELSGLCSYCSEAKVGIKCIKDSMGRTYTFFYSVSCVYISKIEVRAPDGSLYHTLEYNYRSDGANIFLHDIPNSVSQGLLEEVVSVNRSGESQVLGRYSYEDVGEVYDEFHWFKIQGTYSNSNQLLSYRLDGTPPYVDIYSSYYTVTESNKNEVLAVSNLYLLKESWARGTGGTCTILWGKKTLSPDAGKEEAKFEYLYSSGDREECVAYGGYLKKTVFIVDQLQRKTANDALVECWTFDFSEKRTRSSSLLLPLDVVNVRYRTWENLFASIDDENWQFCSTYFTPDNEADFNDSYNNKYLPIIETSYYVSGSRQDILVGNREKQRIENQYKQGYNDTPLLTQRYVYDSDGTMVDIHYSYDRDDLSITGPIYIRKEKYRSKVPAGYPAERITTNFEYDSWMNVTNKVTAVTYYDADGIGEMQRVVTGIVYNSSSDVAFVYDSLYSGFSDKGVSDSSAINLPVCVDSTWYDGDANSATRKMTIYEYNGNGEVTGIAEGSSDSSSFTSDDFQVTRFDYLACGELKSVAGPDGTEVLFSYSSNYDPFSGGTGTGDAEENQASFDSGGDTYTVQVTRSYYKDAEESERVSRTDESVIDVMTGKPALVTVDVDAGCSPKYRFLYDDWGRVQYRMVPYFGKTSLMAYMAYAYTYSETGNDERVVVESYLEPRTGADTAIVLHKQTWKYNNSNRLTSFSRDGREVLQCTYNAAGALMRKEYQPVPTRAGSVARWDEYFYTSLGKVRRIDSHAGDEVRSRLFVYNNWDANEGIPAASYVESYVMDAGGKTAMRTQVYSDPSGRVQRKVWDRNGNKITSKIYYDGAGRMVRTTDPEGFSREYEYNEDGLLSRVTGPGCEVYVDGEAEETQQVVEYSYDPLRRVKEVLQKGTGTVLGFGYDGLGRTVSSRVSADSGTGVETVTVSREYDRLGKVTRSVDALGHETLYEYDPETRLLTRATDADGHAYCFEYDFQGNLKKKTDPRAGNGNYPGVYETEYNYDYSTNTLRSVRLPKNRASDADSVLQRLYYDNGMLKAVISPEGRSQYYLYTGFGELQAVCSADPSSGSYEECWQKEYYYDGFGRLVSECERNGKEVSYDYDSQGNLCKVSDNGGGWVKYEYDRRGMVTSRTQQDLGVTAGTSGTGEYKTMYEYNALGRVTNAYSMVPSSRQSKRSYSYGYDRAGNLVYVKDPRGLERRSRYNGFGRLVEEQDPEGKVVKYEYDENGNLEALIDKAGTTFEYEYSKTNRLTEVEVTPAEGSGGYWKRIARDEAGSVKGITEYHSETGYQLWLSYNNDGGTDGSYVPDVYGRVRCKGSAVNNPELGFKQGVKVYYRYDRDGLLTGIQYPKGRIIEYTYDALGRATGVSGFVDSMEYRSTYSSRVSRLGYSNGISQDHTYSTDGMLIKVDYCGIQNTDGPLQQLYTYDPLGRLENCNSPFHMGLYEYTEHASLDSHVMYLKKNWNVPADDTQGLWSREAVASSNHEKREVQFTYDTNNNLVNRYTAMEGGMYGINEHFVSRDQTWTIDEDSNRVTYAETIYEHDEDLGIIEEGNLFEYLNTSSVVQHAYGYDANGNRAWKESAVYAHIPVGDTTAATDLRFDPEDRLSCSQVENRQAVHHCYTGDGLRIAKFREEDGEITCYAYMGHDLLYEENNSGDYTQYVYLNGKIIGYIEHKGETDETRKYYTLTDRLGSVVNTFDEAGNLRGAVVYGEHGEVVHSCGDSIPRIWAGKKYDEDTGMYYFNARWYDPDQARFVSEDPIKDGENWYAYCGNDPVNFVDPSGLTGEGFTVCSQDVGMDIIESAISFYDGYNYITGSFPYYGQGYFSGYEGTGGKTENTGNTGNTENTGNESANDPIGMPDLPSGTDFSYDTSNTPGEPPEYTSPDRLDYTLFDTTLSNIANYLWTLNVLGQELQGKQYTGEISCTSRAPLHYLAFFANYWGVSTQDVLDQLIITGLDNELVHNAINVSNHSRLSKQRQKEGVAGFLYALGLVQEPVFVDLSNSQEVQSMKDNMQQYAFLGFANNDAIKYRSGELTQMPANLAVGGHASIYKGGINYNETTGELKLYFYDQFSNEGQYNLGYSTTMSNGNSRKFVNGVYNEAACSAVYANIDYSISSWQAFVQHTEALQKSLEK